LCDAGDRSRFKGETLSENGEGEVSMDTLYTKCIGEGKINDALRRALFLSCLLSPVGVLRALVLALALLTSVLLVHAWMLVNWCFIFILGECILLRV
jgi:hypothetical protein